MRGRAKKVALTVDADEATFERIVDALKPDLLQLHGEETPDQVRALKRKFGIPVMKAIPVESANDLVRHSDYAAVADRLLFDARAPRDATRPGGLGKPFDWTLLKNLDPGIPFMLSGGLDAGNVADALAITRAPAVDVSSGVETRPGEKDPDKIRAFIRAARQAQGAAPKLRSRAAHDHPATEHIPRRPRRERPFRNLWRPLCRRDADAAYSRSGKSLSRAQKTIRPSRKRWTDT